MDRFFTYTLTILMCTVALMEFVQVTLRYLFEIPLMGLEESLVFVALWLYFLGSVNASREDTQIRANVLDMFLKTDRSRLTIQLISEVMSIVVSLWLTWHAFDYFLYSLHTWKGSPTLYIPMFFAESSMFVGLMLMSVFVTVLLVKNTRSFIKLIRKEKVV
jgi:TRAP-type C4-dicarboxylate transport system permease small subunit